MQQATLATVQDQRARAFIVWPGSKRRLLQRIVPHFPDTIAHYWEPFVGGGSVFFALAPRIKTAHLSDQDAELVNCYQCVRDDVDRIVDLLVKHQKAHKRHANGTTYYQRVASTPFPADRFEAAAQYLYINRMGLRGSMHRNKAGAFTTPLAAEVDALPNALCADDRIQRLTSASNALQCAEIVRCSYRTIKPRPGSGIYLDPPYFGAQAMYYAEGCKFSIKDQYRLKRMADSWRDSGCCVVLSNRNCALMRKVYADWNKQTASITYRPRTARAGQESTELIIH